MTHPAIQAVLNAKQEYRARLTRIGQTAIQELLQNFFGAVPAAQAVAWTQSGPHCDGQIFQSRHELADVLLLSVDQPVDVFDNNVEVVGVLKDGWCPSWRLCDRSRNLYQLHLKDFAVIPDEVMYDVFGDDVRVEIYRTGKITVIELNS